MQGKRNGWVHTRQRVVNSLSVRRESFTSGQNEKPCFLHHNFIFFNTTVRHKTGLNQWKNSASVINWYSDIPNKNQHTFAVFDIESSYPSITEKLLTGSINFAKQYTNIPGRDIDIIMHSWKSLLFNKDKAWIKKDNSSFDVTMGSYCTTARKFASLLACSS